MDIDKTSQGQVVIMFCRNTGSYGIVLTDEQIYFVAWGSALSRVSVRFTERPGQIVGIKTTIDLLIHLVYKIVQNLAIHRYSNH